MAGHSSLSQDRVEDDLPPGTFLFVKKSEDETQGQQVILLSPVPSSDPNEPLNWSTARKAVNFTLVLAVTCLIFTALSIQLIFWQLMVVDLNVTYTQLNRAMSVNSVGLSMGCVMFIPLAKKYGRRPIYLISTALMLVTAFWTAEIKSLSELYITNLIQGLAGATNEAIVQLTIADIFFVHHRGTMNALYMTMMMIGSFLTPMAAGLQATHQSWRMSYRTLGICNAIIFVLFMLIYEETKYTVVIDGVHESQESIDEPQVVPASSTKGDSKSAITEDIIPQTEASSAGRVEIDLSVPMKSWRQRLALVTYTPEPIWLYYYRPFEILFTFPAVLCCGLQYACGVMWLTIMSSVLSLVLPLPPYLFNPEQIGFMSVGPFIGNLIGSFYGGYLGDRSLRYFARRNKGYFEPEMRLYILHMPAIALCGGLIMFGVTLDRGMHWIYPSIGGALFGFGLGSISDACLTLVIDSHVLLTGDAFTGVAFMRNVFSIGIPFAISPWMETYGLTKMFITVGFISLGVNLMLVVMVIYGKRFRRAKAHRYRELAAQQGQGRGT
ncbi:putative MFS transporter [Aspergillus brunneoviolaceus CBS 621.78]|uniref:Synaptic vesicle transporter n=1 Tax=Aspergillus brunneoviolaceus CBS 621.78 TaxID=1450534 RepID=A0ACD1GD47_9EURO|nr:synaptic vesicle transporter [Aspergillus brunneoviolaceus CBS 621.78]RAH47199.1 synaptic vesicle transporter [Aspergillus brunneoviolaceus CBS 621.78]